MSFISSEKMPLKRFQIFNAVKIVRAISVITKKTLIIALVMVVSALRTAARFEKTRKILFLRIVEV